MRRPVKVTMDDGLILQVDDLATRLGKSRSWVVEQLVLLASWESLVEAVEEGEVQ